jgi:hypothetical protein
VPRTAINFAFSWPPRPRRQSNLPVNLHPNQKKFNRQLTALSNENFFSSFEFNFMASVIEGIFETFASISLNHRLSRRGSANADP